MISSFLRRTIPRLITTAFELFERYTSYPVERLRFRKRLGYPLSLRHPRTFNEKVVWSKLHAHDSLILETASKLGARAYVTRVLGPTTAAEVLVPLLYETGNPETIPFAKLPREYVVKPNHASGWLLFKTIANPLADDVILATCQRWVRSRFGLLMHEWPYARMPRRVLIEQLLRDETGAIPRDYKLYLFHGRCQIIHVDRDRFGHHTRNLYDRAFRPLDVQLRHPLGPHQPPPPTFSRMLNLAETLAQPFSFVRIDFYTIGEAVYVGEFTHWPASGYCPFNPVSFDEWLGMFWQLE